MSDPSPGCRELVSYRCIVLLNLHALQYQIVILVTNFTLAAEIFYLRAGRTIFITPSPRL